LVLGAYLFSSEPLRIVVAGDGRAEYPRASPLPYKSPRAEDEDGINKVITREIVQAVLNEKAKMLLWTGDLTNLTEGDSATFERQLLAWRDIVKPLYDHEIKVLPVRGNHEVVGTTQRTTDPMISQTQRRYGTRYSQGRYALPANGPDGEKNISFFNVWDSMLVVGLDQYANPHSINQPWLSHVLEEQRKPFIFAYGHEPALLLAVIQMTKLWRLIQ